MDDGAAIDNFSFILEELLAPYNRGYIYLYAYIHTQDTYIFIYRWRLMFVLKTKIAWMNIFFCAAI